jgi:glutathione S-transferase
VTKAEMLLKLSGQPYRADTGGFSKAPKGKLPYINDDGETIADSTFIRWHLEKKYGIDFDRGLNAEQRAAAWAFEKLLEDNLYWVLVVERWIHEGNFARGPRTFFRAVPAPMRALVANMIRRKVRNIAKAQGMGRHKPDEQTALGVRTVESVAAWLGDKPFFMGDEPVGVDATVFAFIAGVLCPVFESSVRTAAERHANLKRYVGRITARFYPDFSEIAGCKAAA